MVPLLTFPKLPAEGAEDISLPAQLSPTLSIPACSHARSPNPHFIYNVKSAFLPPTKVTCCPLSTSVDTEGSAPGKSSAPAPYVLFQESGSSIPLRLSPGCFPGAQKQKSAMATGRQQPGGGLKHPRTGSQHSRMGPSPKRTEKSPTKAGDKVNTLVDQLHILGLPRDSCCHLVFVILVGGAPPQSGNC